MLTGATAALRAAAAYNESEMPSDTSYPVKKLSYPHPQINRPNITRFMTTPNILYEFRLAKSHKRNPSMDV